MNSEHIDDEASYWNDQALQHELMDCFYWMSHPEQLYAEEPFHSNWYKSKALHATLWTAVMGVFCLLIVVIRRFYFACRSVAPPPAVSPSPPKESTGVYVIDEKIVPDEKKVPFDDVNPSAPYHTIVYKHDIEKALEADGPPEYCEISDTVPPPAYLPEVENDKLEEGKRV